MSKHNHASNWKGKKQTSTYNSWRSMIQRCTNENHTHYDSYGGRGIRVHPTWYNFETFLMDMGERPGGTTLSRKDNDRGYSPDNCEWATWQTQQRNRRSTKLNEEKAFQIRELKKSGMTSKEISKIFDISKSTVNNVLYRGDWG